MISARATLLFALIAVVACDGAPNLNNQTEPDGPAPIERSLEGNIEVLASGFTIPWGIEIIGEDEYLFTERLGELFHYRNGAVKALQGVPETYSVEVADLVYGGMMDVSLHPHFATNGLVYLAFVNQRARMSVGRFNFLAGDIRDFEVIFESDSFSIGSRIAWEDDDHFFVTQGVGGNPYPEPGPQDLSSDAGKIHRLMADGSIPQDNPIFPGASRPFSIWSYGHRDPQGIWVDSDDGTVFSHEHGPLGGDELNIIERGGNYGWPLYSFGLNYNETAVSSISRAEAEQTTVLPIRHWSASTNLAPSGLVRLEHSLFPSWDGHFLIGSLGKQRLVAYDPASDQTAILLEDVGRVRDVAQLPSGALLLLIDAESPRGSDSGRLVRLTPASS
jgi:glucose/arabinose dehydrogenase